MGWKTVWLGEASIVAPPVSIVILGEASSASRKCCDFRAGVCNRPGWQLFILPAPSWNVKTQYFFASAGIGVNTINMPKFQFKIEDYLGLAKWFESTLIVSVVADLG